MNTLDFPEHADLGKDYAWSAKLTSHDWARMGNLYFEISIYKGEEFVRTFSASANDWMYGDINCPYSETEIREKVRAELHAQASENCSGGSSTAART
jgi:hypothetical protein